MYNSGLRLHVNARFLGVKNATGTHRSSTSFLRTILTQAPKAAHCLVYGDLVDQDELIALGNSSTTWVTAARGGKLQKHFFEQVSFPRAVGEDYALHTMNTGPFLLPSKRQILIIHDLNPFKCLDSFSRTFRAWNFFACKQAIKRSFHIISFSQYVSVEVKRKLGIDASRLSTIYQGPGLDIPPSHTDPLVSEKKKYFLCVGSLQPHKNLPRVVKAWKQTGLSACGYQLKIIGKKQAGFQDLNISPDLLSDTNIEFTGYVSDAELILLYREATALVFPSIEEGFGLPVVEAFYLGCPVITSNRSCLPEIAGDAALLVDPFCVDSIACAIRELATNDSKRKLLMDAGLARAPLFSWDHAGRAFWDLLAKLDERGD